MEHSYSSNGYDRDGKREYQQQEALPLPPLQHHHSAPPIAHHPAPPASLNPTGSYQHPQPPHQHQHQHQHPLQHLHHTPSSTPSTHPPNTSSPQSSPFAFAPPPLSQSTGTGTGGQGQGPSSRPADQHQYYYSKPAPAPYYGSAPMSYRSQSNESRASPQQATRQPPQQQQQVPLPPVSVATGGAASPYNYPRPSPQFAHAPPPPPPQSQLGMGRPYNAYAPMAADMPRSLSYHAPYQPYPYPSPLPPLNRHNTTTGMEYGRPMGYSFANRLPLTDRPFKCDECVQSFNRNHDLKRHKRIHLSVKPFGCDKCGKTFSRKDALRRHWLVKGCRGEDGATAPITPIFPINGTPALSPPTPPSAAPPTSGSTQHSNDFPAPLSFAHPGAPPPLGTLPSRQPSDQSSILITPQDSGSLASRDVAIAPLDEPMIDPLLQPTQRNSGSSDGYFEGVVGLKHDGTALLERRSSPKPQFAMPFYSQHSQQQQQQPNHNGMLTAHDMEKRGSHGPPDGWSQQAKWHRPSFPFPPRQGNYYTSEASPENHIAAPAYTTG